MSFEIAGAVEQEIQNDALDCTDGVANTFLRGCDLLKEDMEELGKKLGIKNDERLDKNWTIYFDYNQIRHSTGKKMKKYFIWL